MTNEIQEVKQRQYTVTFLRQPRRGLWKDTGGGFRLTELVFRHLESASILCVHLH